MGRIGASPGLKAQCPQCKNTVIAKCGEINIWHWSHLANECDSWSEPESRWHIKWKERFAPELREVVIGPHRADVKTNKLVVEFQNSSISAGEIQERELFYKNMVWVVNAREFASNLSFRSRDGFASFRWYHPRKSWWSAKQPLIFDIGEEEPLFHVKKIHDNVPCGGWGKSMDISEFMSRCFLRK